MLHALQTNGAVRPIVRKKAATCLLRLIRKSPPEAEILQPDVWSVKLVRCHSACCGHVILDSGLIGEGTQGVGFGRAVPSMQEVSEGKYYIPSMSST
jgi:hypothetical protein